MIKNKNDYFFSYIDLLFISTMLGIRQAKKKSAKKRYLNQRSSRKIDLLLKKNFSVVFVAKNSIQKSNSYATKINSYLHFYYKKLLKFIKKKLLEFVLCKLDQNQKSTAKYKFKTVSHRSIRKRLMKIIEELFTIFESFKILGFIMLVVQAFFEYETMYMSFYDLWSWLIYQIKKRYHNLWHLLLLLLMYGVGYLVQWILICLESELDLTRLLNFIYIVYKKLDFDQQTYQNDYVDLKPELLNQVELIEPKLKLTNGLFQKNQLEDTLQGLIIQPRQLTSLEYYHLFNEEFIDIDIYSYEQMILELDPQNIQIELEIFDEINSFLHESKFN